MRQLAERPRYEVADVIRKFGQAFYQSRGLPPRHWQVLAALRDCRTAALGGHIDYCGDCGTVQGVSYNSCRNRHCPKCGGLERELWIAAREAELLPVPYQHIVFTVPAELNDWCRYNPEFCYGLLFRAAWQALSAFAEDRQWLGARAGATMVLHTWGQNLMLHPHVHCIVPAGGLDGQGRWKAPRRRAGFLFPVKALSKVFKSFYLKAFRSAWQQGQLAVPPQIEQAGACPGEWCHQRYGQAWAVYAKRPFATPKTVVEYLGRYTHKVAISNHRILDIGEGSVTFRYKDYRQGGKNKAMKLSGAEFLRRFCLHILPRGFRRIRHYGILASRGKAAALAAARSSLGAAAPPQRARAELKELLLEQWFGPAPGPCPHCGSGLPPHRTGFGPQSARAPPIVADAPTA